MARFNEILAPRLNRALQKFTGIKGPAPTPQLSTEFLPVFPFFWGAEMRAMESWARFGIATLQGALAAQQSYVKLRNPAGSRVVAVVEKMNISNSNAAAAEYRIGFGSNTGNTNTDTVALTNAVRLDPRQPTLSPTCIPSVSNIASQGFPVIQESLILPNTTLDYILFEDQELTILPGDAVIMFTSSSNLNIGITLMWRERGLEESELS